MSSLQNVPNVVAEVYMSSAISLCGVPAASVPGIELFPLCRRALAGLVSLLCCVLSNVLQIMVQGQHLPFPSVFRPIARDPTPATALLYIWLFVQTMCSAKNADNLVGPMAVGAVLHDACALGRIHAQVPSHTGAAPQLRVSGSVCDCMHVICVAEAGVYGAGHREL